MEGTMAVITPVAYDFTPRYWAQCNGQLLAISTNSALFSLLGTMYGGNGIQTFGLPDLRGRSAVSAGNSSTGTSYQLAEVAGTTTSTLGMSNMPAHNHNGTFNVSIGASTDGGFEGAVDGNYMGSGVANSFSPNDNVNMVNPLSMQASVGTAGGSVPFSVQSPYIALNYVICMQGIYPSRS